MSRIISGKTRLDMQAIDLTALIEAAVETLVPAAAAKKVQVVKLLEPVETISGDPARLQQVLWNLLANAIKFTPRGAGSTWSSRRATPRSRSRCAITAKGSRRNFSPSFSIASGNRTLRGRAGTAGSGSLSIVKHLVELHGGNVRVESEGLGQGTAFTITLPLGPRRADEGNREHSAALRQQNCLTDLELAGVCVVVIDDERDSLELVRRLLRDCKADVFVASSAEDGLRLVSAESPDVIVSDIGMPEKEGLEMMRELRARTDRGHKTPAIALPLSRAPRTGPRDARGLPGASAEAGGAAGAARRRRQSCRPHRRRDAALA